MNIYEFIFKLENSKGLKPINFDEKELTIPLGEGMPDISLYQEDGIGVIKLAGRKKVREMPDLRYYAVAKNKAGLDKLIPLLKQHFINNVYVLNDGQIAILLTNTNQEKILITDVALDNEFITDNSLESLIAWFNKPSVGSTPENEEGVSTDDIDKYLGDKDDTIKTKNQTKITNIPQPTREFGEKVILIVDRFVREEVIRQTFSVLPNKQQYKNASIHNFYAMLDDEGNSYMLEIISLIEQINIEPGKKLELYEQIKDVCKAWFNKVKSLGITDICCRRVFKSDRNLTPETVIWLWGYFVLGQKCNWILSNGSLIRGMKNEFLDTDTKEGRYYEGEARKALGATRPYIVNLPAQYMTLGAASYLVDTGFENNSIEWKSDNISLESHIVGAMGNYNRVSNNKPIEEQIDDLTRSVRLETYKQFVKSFYGV